MNSFLFGYLLVFAFLVVLGRVILHWRIFPELKRRGIPYSAGKSGDLKALSDYRRVCLAEGTALSMLYVMMSILGLLVIGLVVWFLLIGQVFASGA